MQANAIISSTAIGGKKLSTTISHLRPSQESKAEQLGIALNALTTNVYQSTKVNEIDITDFTPVKIPPEMTLANKCRVIVIDGDNTAILDILSCNVNPGEINAIAITGGGTSGTNEIMRECIIIKEGSAVLEGTYGYINTKIRTGTAPSLPRIRIGIAETNQHYGYFLTKNLTWG